MLRRGVEVVVLLILGALLGVLGAFLVPVRLFGHLHGVAVLVAAAGNFAAGLIGAELLERPAGALVPGASWLGCVILASVQWPSGSLIITSSTPADPGLGPTGVAFLVVGVGAIAAAGWVAGRRLPRSRTGSGG